MVASRGELRRIVGRSLEARESDEERGGGRVHMSSRIRVRSSSTVGGLGSEARFQVKKSACF